MADERTDEGLTREQLAELQELATSLRGPPPELEDAVVSSLHEEGLLVTAGRRRPSSWRSLGLAAAALLLFTAGAATERWLLRSPSLQGADGRARYLLLLLEPDGSTLLPEVEAERVREYSSWARRLAEAGVLEAGEKLADPREMLGPDPVAPSPNTADEVGERVTGFFVVRASSEQEALDVARSCPHLVHGGRVEVRRIEET